MTTSADGVALRALCVRGLPMLVAVMGVGGRSRLLLDTLADAGVRDLPGFIGYELPKGARVGFVLDAVELRLVDEQDDALMRAPLAGIDADWIAAAVQLKGTMLIVLTDDVPDAELRSEDLVRAVDEAARRGAAHGAIVGVHDERTRLPLIF